jgi:hypothetical protein
MRYLSIALVVFIIACSSPTQYDDCSEYLFKEYVGYAGSGYGVFVNESDSVGVEMEDSFLETHPTGKRYTLCFDGSEVIIK